MARAKTLAAASTSPYERAGSAGINAMVERVAPAILGLLADGVPRTKAAIIEALAGRYDRQDVVHALIRLAVTGRGARAPAWGVIAGNVETSADGLPRRSYDRWLSTERGANRAREPHMHLHTKAGLLGLAILGTASAARAADIPANTRTKAIITPGPTRFDGVFEKGGDSDWYQVTLKAGRNYAFEASAYCDTRVYLRDAGGKLLRQSSFASDESGDAGFEFRSATTKTYFVEYVDPNPVFCADFAGPYPHVYSGNVAMEVRGDTTTRGTIAPEQTISSLLNWDTDQDFFRAQLDAKRSYSITLGGPKGEGKPGGIMAWVVDPRGKIVAHGQGRYDPPVGFRVPTRGTYYVVVAGDDYDYGPYSVALTSP